jgi:predicted CXXCH cytochrome family protein
LLDDGLYWNDGQQRDEVYNWGSFLQSRMNAHGVTCSDCHDPHTLKLRADGNAVCAQCHQPAKYAAVTHTHHAEGTGATACVACHMPTTTYMVVDPRPDHSLRIPRPDISAKVGSPNACNNCHVKETPQWAAAAIHQWTGKDPTSFQTFAEALYAGTLGAPGAREALTNVINDPAQPAIVRASAINRLGNLLSPSVVPVLATALGDSDANVRLAAVEALAQAPVALRQRYLSPLLSDPVLAVRIEAAHALVGEPEQGLPAAQQQAMAKAIAEYIAVQTYDADRPEGRMSLGNLAAQRGDAEGAIREYRKAMELEPSFVASYINLADLYRARGNESLATRTLREGLARNPKEAALHYALGLALVRDKQPAEALAELQAATRLAPQNARYAYVYGVALSDGGRAAEAARVLTAALKQSPFDRDILAALADFATQAGHRDEALAYAGRLRAVDPENPQYAQIEAQLRAGR